MRYSLFMNISDINVETFMQETANLSEEELVDLHTELLAESKKLDELAAKINAALDVIDHHLAPWDDEHDQFMHDGEADGDALASAGFGTDEDYGGYGDDGGW